MLPRVGDGMMSDTDGILPPIDDVFDVRLWTSSWGMGPFTSCPGFCFFHFVRRFWNHIFTYKKRKDSNSPTKYQMFLIIINYLFCVKIS